MISCELSEENDLVKLRSGFVTTSSSSRAPIPDWEISILRRITGKKILRTIWRNETFVRPKCFQSLSKSLAATKKCGEEEAMTKMHECWDAWYHLQVYLPAILCFLSSFYVSVSHLSFFLWFSSIPFRLCQVSCFCTISISSNCHALPRISKARHGRKSVRDTEKGIA